MTFGDVFSSAELGDVFTVSDGKTQPSGGLRLAVWRSHNFTGPLLAKLDAEATRPRRLRIQAVNEGGVTIAYDVAEDYAHTFTPAE